MAGGHRGPSGAHPDCQGNGAHDFASFTAPVGGHPREEWPLGLRLFWHVRRRRHNRLGAVWWVAAWLQDGRGSHGLVVGALAGVLLGIDGGTGACASIACGLGTRGSSAGSGAGRCRYLLARSSHYARPVACLSLMLVAAGACGALAGLAWAGVSAGSASAQLGVAVRSARSCAGAHASAGFFNSSSSCAVARWVCRFTLVLACPGSSLFVAIVFPVVVQL